MNGCKACLRVIEVGNPIFYLSDIYMDPMRSSSDAISIKDKLTDCVPELLLDSANNAVICKPCVSSLMVAYDFRQQCLQVQQKIHGFLQQIPIKTEIDIDEIPMHYERPEVLVHGGNDSIAVVGSNNECILSPPNELNMHIETNKSLIQSKMCENMYEISVKQEPSKNTKKPTKKTHPKHDYKCKICHNQFETDFLLRHHIRTHNKKFRIECSRCQGRFKKAADLEAHMKTKHKHYTCSSFNYEDEVNPMGGHSNTAPKETRSSKKRKLIKEQKRLLAEMPPLLVITPRRL